MSLFEPTISKHFYTSSLFIYYATKRRNKKEAECDTVS